MSSASVMIIDFPLGKSVTEIVNEATLLSDTVNEVRTDISKVELYARL